MRRWIWASLAVVVDVASGVGAYVVYRKHKEATSLTSTNSAQYEAANAEARQMTGPITFGDTRVDVLGDSYWVGTTLPNPQRQAWDVLLAKREHWNLKVRGVGRTGFVNGGYCGNQSFSTRVAEVLADHPQLVIIEGGLNDAGQPGIGAAAQALLAMIPTHDPGRRRRPHRCPGASAADKQTSTANWPPPPGSAMSRPCAGIWASAQTEFT